MKDNPLFMTNDCFRRIRRLFSWPRFRFASRSRFLLLVSFSLWCSFAVPSRAQECGAERYFDPADANNERPLARPHAEFTKTRQLASRGNAAEQRSLAIAYEIGYLVSPCPERAFYWYGKAARGGDEIAQQLMERVARVERMRQGRECYDKGCNAVSGEAVEAMALEADARGQYSAPVTINGVTVNGLIDTGATAVSMSARVAQQMGIAYLNGRRVQMHTANGTTSGYTVMLNSVTVGRITLQQVRAVVGESDMPVLIGATFLRRVSVAMDGRRMTMTKR